MATDVFGYGPMRPIKTKSEADVDLKVDGPSISSEHLLVREILHKSLRVFALFLLCSLSVQSHAQTTGQKSTGPVRLESVKIGERGTELLVTFDRPISHGRSWLSLVRDGKVVATLHPRLETEPNVLFVRIQTPPSGNYLVRWTVCPQGGSDCYDGEFPFTVGDAPKIAADPTRWGASERRVIPRSAIRKLRTSRLLRAPSASSLVTAGS
jgi:methionine-rich copper-binding protein CopC